MQKGKGCCPKEGRFHEGHGLNSSPSCNVKPESLLRPLGLSASGGTRLSKFRPLLAPLERGVLERLPGVRPPRGRCAGLGVTLTKSAKLNCWLGVPKLANTPPLGVGVKDGKAAYWLGGVDGGRSRDCALLLTLAGVGELAKYRRRSAPSSFSWYLSFLGRRAGRRGGVRGGEELTMDELTFWKL